MTTHRCLVFDFDETMVHTITQPSPFGGVVEAYEDAVEQVFGLDGLEKYLTSGGLRNRSPREVVADLAGENTSASLVGEMTEQLVAYKISFLVRAIGHRLPDGSTWPPLTPGFAQFWQYAGELGLPRFILSSGHHDFILKCFESHNLELPLAMLTDDILRCLPDPLNKPDVRLWTELTKLAQWSGIQLGQALYFGDDPVKDGNLVRSLPEVDFLLFDPLGKYPSLPTFNDWSKVRLPNPGWKTW